MAETDDISDSKPDSLPKAEKVEKSNPAVKSKPKRQKTRRRAKGSMAMDLHRIEEQDSDIENDGDEELNRSFDLLMGIHSKFNTKLNDNSNKSMNIGKPMFPHSQKTSPIKGPMHPKFRSIDVSKLDNTRLKQFIHNRSKYEKEEKDITMPQRQMEEEKLRKNELFRGGNFS